ncbi:hypothetical protein B0H14DRAFT_3510553 [Mycena olivaceomarginata]|nr:hypothetical protein B0H14DRAFT_3510553 [Mycena olivaceomarginata]
MAPVNHLHEQWDELGRTRWIFHNGILHYRKQLPSETNTLPTIWNAFSPLELAPAPLSAGYDLQTLSSFLQRVGGERPSVYTSPTNKTDALLTIMDDPRKTTRLSLFLNAQAPSDATTWPCLELGTYSEVSRPRRALRTPKDNRSPQQRWVASLLPYMHPETPHVVPCPLETPATRMAPLETWEVVEEGYSQPSPTLYFSCTLLLAPQLETGHISYIRSFVSVLPLTPPSAGSLLTGPGVTIPGFLN